MDYSPTDCLSFEESSVTTERLTKIRQIHSINMTSEKKQETTVKGVRSIEESLIAPAIHDFLPSWARNANELMITSFDPNSSTSPQEKTQEAQPTPNFYHKTSQGKQQTSSEVLLDRINMSTLIFDEIHKNKCYSDLLIQRFHNPPATEKENVDLNQGYEKGSRLSCYKSKPYSHFQYISRADLEKYNRSSTSSGNPKTFNSKTHASLLRDQTEAELFAIKEKVLNLRETNARLKKDIECVKSKEERCNLMRANYKAMLGILFVIQNEGFNSFMMVNALVRANTMNPEIRALKEQITRLERIKEQQLFDRISR